MNVTPAAILTRRDAAYSYEDSVEVGDITVILWSVDRQVVLLDEDGREVAAVSVPDWTAADAAARAVWLAGPFLTADETAALVTALAEVV